MIDFKESLKINANNSTISFNDNKNFIIDNSPVKFAIIGASRDNREVLLRSSDAGLDLIGSYSINSNLKKMNKSQSILNSFINKEFQYEMIRSKEKYKINENNDERNTDYWFIWKGYANDKIKDEIQSEFDLRIKDIRNGLAHGSYGTIEWSIAPIITMCNNASVTYLERKKKNKLIIAILLAYTFALFMSFSSIF